MLEEVNACSLLLTTDPFWSAYRLSGTFEWLRPSVSNTTIFRIVLNPGLVLSFVIRIIVTLYFLAMGGLRCLILYRRNDEEWKILAEKAKAFDPNRYYQLGVATDGNQLRCWCEDTFLTATDRYYARDRVDLRGNSPGKIASATVEMTPGQQKYHHIVGHNYQKRVEHIREKQPRLNPAVSIDLRKSIHQLTNTSDLIGEVSFAHPRGASQAICWQPLLQIAANASLP